MSKEQVDWTDDYIGDITLMMTPIVDKYNLSRGEMSPEDVVALCQILSRYIDSNKQHAFKALPIQEQLDTIAFSWWGSAAVNPLHVVGVHVDDDPDKVQAFLDEYYKCDSTQLDKLLLLHEQYKEDGVI